MPLIRFRQRTFTPQIRRNGERDLGEPAERWRIPVPETAQRIRERTLPTMAQTLRETRLQSVIIGLADVRNHSNDAVQREGAMADVRVRIGNARRRIKRDVDVILDRFLVTALGVDVIDFERGVVRKLVCYADRALPTVRDMRVIWNRSLLLEIAEQTARPVVDVAESLECLIIG